MIWLIAAPVAVVVGWLWTSYNRFVRQRQLVGNSWAGVDTELRRRYDLIPNLVRTVEAYADHERETFEEVATARAVAVTAGGRSNGRSAPEEAFVASIGHLLAVAEAHPRLQADAHFRDLQEQLVVTEDRIQAARRIHNGNVRDYNQRVEQVPSRLVARLGGFGQEAYFEVETAIRTNAPHVATSADARDAADAA